MTRTKRHTLRRIALGLAVAAIVPATAQARPMDLSGSDARAIHAQAVPVETASLVGAEDLAFSRQPQSTPALATADSNDGYDAGVGSIGGLILILAAAGAAVAVRHSRKAKLSPA